MAAAVFEPNPVYAAVVRTTICAEFRAQFGRQPALRPTLGCVWRCEFAAGIGLFGTQTDSGAATQRF